MVRRFYFRYDSKLIYSTDDFIEFLDIVVKINESKIFDTVFQVVKESLVFSFVVKNSYTNIPSDAFRRSILIEWLKT